MKNCFSSLTFATLLHLGFGKLPINFQTCKIGSGFNACLGKAIEDGLHKLADGFPEINVPSLEPLNVPSMTIGEGEGAVHVVQNYKDLKISGASKTNLTKVDGSKIKEFRLYTETLTPSLKIQAKYNLNGRILLIPIVGDGDCTIILENLRATHTSIGEKLEKNGKIYMQVKQYLITLHPGKVEFKFNNLFNGNERLGTEMNNLLTENWKEVFEDVKEGYEEAFGLIFGDVANKIYSRIPFKDLFLE